MSEEPAIDHPVLGKPKRMEGARRLYLRTDDQS